jgi:cell division GTPase FtsZ
MMNNDFMKNYGFLGIGAFGGNATRLFELAGYPCIVANSSFEDLRQLKDANNKIHFIGGNGCHKDRRKSKVLLKDNVEALISEVRAKMPEITTLFIFASSAGGTGSGMLAAAAKILKSALGVNVCIVTALPARSEQFKAFANTVELFGELERLDDIGAMFILDNDKRKDKLEINEAFCTHIRVYDGNVRVYP